MNTTIRNILVISTAHLSESTARHFDKATGSDLSAVGQPISYGYFMIAVENFEEMTEIDPELSEMPELEAISNYALENDCFMIRFDCDAEEIDSLETFDW